MPRKAAKKQRPKAGTTKGAYLQRAKLFAEAYLANGGNQTDAARSAGYKPGVGAERAGCRLIRDVRVRQLIEAGKARAIERAEFNADSVLRSLRRAVEFDPRKLWHPDGRMKQLHELDDDTALAISQVEVERVEIPRAKGKGKQSLTLLARVRADSRTTAREQAMKRFGLLHPTPTPPSPVDEEEDGDMIVHGRRVAFVLAMAMRKKATAPAAPAPAAKKPKVREPA